MSDQQPTRGPKPGEPKPGEPLPSGFTRDPSSELDVCRALVPDDEVDLDTAVAAVDLTAPIIRVVALALARGKVHPKSPFVKIAIKNCENTLANILGVRL